MDITKILNTNRVILDMKATSKTEAIEELTDILQKDGAISCRETFIQDVWQRESEGSTASKTILRSRTGNPRRWSIPRWRLGVPARYSLGNLDGSNVRCIILFAVRLEDQNTTHIRLLSQVAGALADDDIIEQLLVESSPQKIIELFSQYAESNVC